MVEFSKLREELNIAAASGAELTSDERKLREWFALVDRVEAGRDDRDRRVAVASAAANKAREERRASGCITFPGKPRADDDLVVLGRGRDEYDFRLLHRPDGTAEFFGDRAPVVVGSDNVHRCVSDGDTLEGHTARFYMFREYRTVHYIPRDVYAALPRRHQDRIGARTSAPTDLWAWSGGPESRLPFERSQGSDGCIGQPTDEQINAATASAISSIRNLVDGCDHGDLLRHWHADVGGDAHVQHIVRKMIARRLETLGERVELEPTTPEAA